MNTAVGIIERRVNGLGVSEAEVQTQGSDNIIVNIPKGTNAKQAREQVGTTAQLVLPPGARTGGHRRPPQPRAERAASGSASAVRRGPATSAQPPPAEGAVRHPVGQPPPRRAARSPTR